MGLNVYINTSHRSLYHAGKWYIKTMHNYPACNELPLVHLALSRNSIPSPAPNHIHSLGPTCTWGAAGRGAMWGGKNQVQSLPEPGSNKIAPRPLSFGIMLILLAVLPIRANQHGPELKGGIINSRVLGYQLWLLSRREKREKRTRGPFVSV